MLSWQTREAWDRGTAGLSHAGMQRNHETVPSTSTLALAFVFLEPRARTSSVSTVTVRVSAPVVGPVHGPVTTELEAAPGAAPTLGPRLGLPGSLAIGAVVGACMLGLPGSLAIGAGRLRAPPRGAVLGACMLGAPAVPPLGAAPNTAPRVACANGPLATRRPVADRVQPVVGRFDSHQPRTCEDEGGAVLSL